MAVRRVSPGARPAAVLGLTVVAAVLFAAVFRFGPPGRLDFFALFSIAAGLASGSAFAVDTDYAGRLAADLRSGLPGKAAAGLASAAVLYGLFAVGRALSRLLLPFAAAEIGRVYALKSGVPAVRIVLLVGLVIGPAEEIFWRGFVQERMAGMTGRTRGLLLTSLLYAAVHVASGNVMLVLAAAVCGLFWGSLYLRFRSPVLNVVSHTIWDLAVLVIFPF